VPLDVAEPLDNRRYGVLESISRVDRVLYYPPDTSHHLAFDGLYEALIARCVMVHS